MTYQVSFYEYVVPPHRDEQPYYAEMPWLDFQEDDPETVVTTARAIVADNTAGTTMAVFISDTEDDFVWDSIAEFAEDQYL